MENSGQLSAWSFKQTLDTPIVLASLDQSSSLAAWKAESQACWSNTDTSQCKKQGDQNQIEDNKDIPKRTTGDLKPANLEADTKAKVNLPDLMIVGDSADEKSKAKPATDDKDAKRKAHVEILLDAQANPEARIKATKELLKSGVDKIEIEGADAKSYTIRLEAVKAGTREMVHAFLRSEDGKESTALRGILASDGTVGKERNKKGEFVDFEGRAADQLNAIKASKIEFKQQEQTTNEVAPASKRVEKQEEKPKDKREEKQEEKREEKREDKREDSKAEKPRQEKAEDKTPKREAAADKADNQESEPEARSKKYSPLQRVNDPEILARVPDAKYIGPSGRITSMDNRAGEIKPYWLAADAANAFAEANEMLAAKGKRIILQGKNAAGRTVDTQTEIYTRSNGGKSFAAGAPTSSNHTRGRALDIANYQDPDVARALKAVGFRQGDSRGPIKGDEHHFSFPGHRKRK